MADSAGFQNEADLSALEGIEGWWSIEDRDFCLSIMRMQRQRRSAGAALELGVHHGRFIALLCSRYESVVGIDAWLDEFGADLDPESVRYVERRVEEACLAFCGRAPRLVRSKTKAIPAEMLDRYSFIHIDAGHEAEDVLADLVLASRHLAPEGVIVLDDAFASLTPGVCEAVFTFNWSAAGLSPFAVGPNKLYACRTVDADTYRDSLCGAKRRQLLGREVGILH